MHAPLLINFFNTNAMVSGIKVSVKCEGKKNLGVATTEDDGSFKVDLPSPGHAKHPKYDVNCLVKLLGGPNPLYASRKNQVSQIVKGENSYTYTISTPLSFFTSCPQNTQCNKELGSSKTIDLPVPPEWGLAPTSYYLPFFPIIGIP